MSKRVNCVRFRDVVWAFGSQVRLIRLIDHPVKSTRVSNWVQRDYIPSGLWESIVRASKRAGINGITLSLLAKIARRDLLIKEGYLPLEAQNSLDFEFDKDAV